MFQHFTKFIVLSHGSVSYMFISMSVTVRYYKCFIIEGCSCSFCLFTFTQKVVNLEKNQNTEK